MKTEKKNYYFIRTMEILMEGDLHTTEELSTKVKVSEKTMRTKIEEINNLLNENELGKILKKPRVGIWYEANEQEKKKLKSLMFNSETSAYQVYGSTQTNDERLYSALLYIFKNRKKEIITTQKMANNLYLSIPTILKVLKDCELWFKKYNIDFENHRSKGIVIHFDENNYRRAVQKLILQGSTVKNIEKNIMELLPGIRTDLVKKAILNSENEWKFEFVDASFYEILVYCCVTVQRGNKENISIDNEDMELLKKYSEFQFAKTILSLLSKECGTIFSDKEVGLLAIQILCAKFLEKDSTIDSITGLKEYDEQLIHFTNDVVNMSSNILGVDLNDDETLKSSLLVHLRSTLFRLKYSTLVPNVLVYHIKKQYKHVFRAMWGLSILFERYFDCNITEDELGFICLYFQAALERKKIKMKKILLVSTHPRSTNQFLIQKIKNFSPNDIDVEVVGLHDFKISNYSKVEIILTTDQLQDKDERIIEMEDIIGEEWMQNLISEMNKHQINKGSNSSNFSVECHSLFDPDLIFVDVECEDKDELIEILSSKLCKKGYVTKRFHETVKLREKETTTEIGNGIALPHGDQRLVNVSKVAVATLTKPIIWNQEEVDVVFLLAIKMTSREEVKVVQKFYKEYITLVETEEKIQVLKGNKSNLALYNYFIR